MVVSEREEMGRNYWKCINPTEGYCYCSYYHYYYYYCFCDCCYYIFRGIPEEAVKRKLPEIEHSEGGDGDSLGHHSFPGSCEPEEGGASGGESGSPLCWGTASQAAGKRQRVRAGALVQAVQAVALRRDHRTPRGAEPAPGALPTMATA